MIDDIATAEDVALANLLKRKQAEVFDIASELARRGYTVNAQSQDRDAYMTHDRYYPAQEYRVTVAKTEVNTTYL